MKQSLKKLFVLMLIVALLPLSFVGRTKAMTGLTVTATPSTVGSNASYAIQFTIPTVIPAAGAINVYFAGFTGSNGTKSINGFILSSTGGGGSIASVVVSNGPMLTITLGSAMNPGTVYLIIPQTAGIYNPATAGSYTVAVYTSSGESGSCSVPIGGGAQTVTVTVNPLSAGSIAYYSVQFIPGISLVAGDFIYITFPAGSVLPSTIPQSLITVNNYPSPSVIIYSGTTIRITVPIAITAGAPCTVYIPTSIGIQNPPTAGSYSIAVYTSKELTPISSALYTITGSNITYLSVSVSPNSAGVAANYYIQFMTGPSGALTANNIITINFPSGTVVPSYSGSYITINGYPCTTAASGTNLYIYIPSGLSIGNSAWVSISILSSFGIINPTVAGTYTLKLSTSADTVPATSNSYSITGTSVSNFNVTVDPNTQSSAASITATFTTSSTGALSRSASDKINIQFDTAFNVPYSISANTITVNGTQVSYVNISGDNLAITTPVDIGNNSNVTVVISSSANIRNPSTSGTYNISLSTTKDVVPDADTVQIVKSIITKPVVTLTSYAINDNVGITVNFNTGSGGALTANSDTISIQFPTGFAIPSSIPAQYVKVNNYQAYSVSKSGTRLDIKPSINIPASYAISVVIDKNAGIKNPVSQGSYKITVYTNEEATPIDSDPFNIVTLPKTTATVNPLAPNGQNGYYTTTPKVTLTATSPVDNNPVIYYYFDGGTPVQYTVPISVPDGTHTLYFYAMDRFQNKEVAQSMQFKVDTVPPTITVAYPQNNAILNVRNFTITGKTEASATLTINGNPVSVGADGSFSYDAAISGPATFTIVSRDIAGNTSQFLLTVSLDTTPPKLVISEPKAFQEVHTQFVAVKGQTEKDAKVTVNGLEIAVNPADYSFSYSLQLTTPGLNSINVVAVDLAGNQTTAAIPVNFIPKTKIILQVGNTVALVNDKTVKLDAPPKIINGRTLVPLRFVAEAFGASVKWNSVFKLVFITLQDKEIVLQIGTSYASVGDSKYTLDTAPIIDKGNTLVPIRFIAEAFNSSVEWDEKTKTVTIVYPK